MLGEKVVVDNSTEQSRNEIRGLGGKADAAAKRAKKEALAGPTNIQQAAQAEAEVARDEQTLAAALNTLAPAPSIAIQLGEDQEFSAGGEAHSLVIEERGRSARVILASHPAPLSAHLAEFRTEPQTLEAGDKRTQLIASIDAASALAQRLDQDIAAALASTAPRGDSQRIAPNESISRDERALRPLLSTIFDGLNIQVPDKVPGPVVVTFAKAPSLIAGDEYARQLSRQESEINAMVVNDWLQRRAMFAARGRDPSDPEERRIFRERMRNALVQSLTRGAGRAVPAVKNEPYVLGWVNQTLANRTSDEQKNGIPESTAIGLVETFMRTQAALREPDQVAGGEVRPRALGSRDINRDIGQNWGGIFGKPTPGAADRMESDTRNALKQIRPLFWGKVKMNVKLT